MVVVKRACLIGGVTSFLAYIVTLRSSYSQLIATTACSGTNSNSSIQLKNYSYYPEFEESFTPSINNNSANELNFTNKVIHRAQFGLGHRLDKISNAWHLTKALNLTRMELIWRDCSGEGNIFPHLFGSDHIDVPGSERAAMGANALRNVHKNIYATNDVAGYYGGQNFKDHQVPLSEQVYKGDDSPFLEKQDSDLQLFQILRQRFVGKEDAIRFMEEHNFRDHFVVGLHLRLGNDEPSHFTTSGRGVENQLEFVYNLIDLIRSFLESLQISHPERFVNNEVGGGDCPPSSSSWKTKPPLIFLATDSPKFIPIIANDTSLFGVKTIAMPQIRVETGVTFYQLKAGAKCLRGWQEMFMDSMLLSFSDVLIAARYSSFTQILPMTLVFDRGSKNHGPRFCEVSDTAKRMTCLEDVRTWLFRDNAQKMFSYSIDGENVTVDAVVHRLGTHFPDVVVPDKYSMAASFLDSSKTVDRRHGGMVYGPTFDPKYRGKLACPGCVDFIFT